ncbi:hypothetical protein [Sedimentibacter sp. LTW-03]|uniref:hypothetical protein n=1 Tax=Sedimentibacter sp. LTW-03 TaxID=3453406 RepID=UPI003F865CE4
MNFYRVNVDCLDKYLISVGSDFTWSIQNDEWNTILYKQDVFSIYYRKPRFPDLSKFEPEYRNMINNDILALINGLVDSFNGKVLTKPSILRKCENKIYQLMYALSNDINIPNSFIGNNSESMKLFEKYKTIIKPITTGKIYRKTECEIYQTSYFNGFQEEILLTPIYLQEYIVKLYEVRITIVNETVFPIKIESENILDWRKGYDSNYYSVIDVPDYVLKKSIKMMEDFNLKFGAFDYIVNDKNEWVFLEVNPNGQWQWLEKELNLNISNEIVQYLIE